MASTVARLSILLRPRAPTRCNWTSWFDNTQKRLDVVRDVRAQNSHLAPARLRPMRRARLSDHAQHRESGYSVGVGGGLA